MIKIEYSTLTNEYGLCVFVCLIFYAGFEQKYSNVLSSTVDNFRKFLRQALNERYIILSSSIEIYVIKMHQNIPKKIFRIGGLSQVANFLLFCLPLSPNNNLRHRILLEICHDGYRNNSKQNGKKKKYFCVIA